MLRIHLFSIFTVKTPQALNREDTDKMYSNFYVETSKQQQKSTVMFVLILSG